MNFTTSLRGRSPMWAGFASFGARCWTISITLSLTDIGTEPPRAAFTGPSGNSPESTRNGGLRFLRTPFRDSLAICFNHREGSGLRRYRCMRGLRDNSRVPSGLNAIGEIGSRGGVGPLATMIRSPLACLWNRRGSDRCGAETIVGRSCE